MARYQRVLMKSPPPESWGMQSLVDAIPIALAVFDADGRLAGANARYAELTALLPGEAASRSLEDPWPDSRHILESATVAAREHRRATTTLVETPQIAGMRATEVTIAPYSGGWVFAGVDVSEREQMRHAIVRDAGALHGDRDREQSLAMIGQLSAGLMHDVNNVLNPVLAAAYLIESFAGDEAAVRTYAKRITDAAQGGVTRLAQLRQFVRQEPMDPSGPADAVDLAEVAAAAIAAAKPAWADRDPERAIQVEERLSSGAKVRGTAEDLRRAIGNLLQNAADALPNGGTVRVSANREDGIAVLEVADTGVGMPADARRRAFEPFFTSRGRRAVGLGLAEVYGVVKRHRGVAELESAEGKGTVVRLRFPLAQSGEAGSLEEG